MKVLGGFLVGLVVIALLTWLFFFKSVVVEPGHEVVLVDQPYFFGHEGVRPEPVKEGRVYVFSSTKDIPVSVVPQSISVAFNDFTSSDNILLDFESTVQTRIINSPVLVSKFGSEWFNNNIKSQYTALVRNEVKSHSMSDMMSSRDVANKVDDYLTESIRKLVKDNDIPVEVISISLGRAKPNEDVLHQMNLTAAEQQRGKTIDASKLAEDKRKQEQKSKADADNEYRKNMDMTPEQYIELQKINAYAEACKKATNCIVTSNQAQPVMLGSK